MYHNELKYKLFIFYEVTRMNLIYECRIIADTQLENGSWPITWGWSDYQNEFAISANWWKSNFIIKNLLFLKNMCGM